jgi:hypothetical protein
MHSSQPEKFPQFMPSQRLVETPTFGSDMEHPPGTDFAGDAF